MSVEKARRAALRAAFERDVDEFVAGAGRGASEALTRSRGRDLRHYTTWLQKAGVPSARRIAPDHLAAYADELQRLASPATVRRRLDIARAWHRFLARERGYEDASRLLDMPRPDASLQPLLWADDARRVLQSPDPATLLGLRDRVLLHLLFEAGLSAREICALHVGDYKRTPGVLTAGRRDAKRTTIRRMTLEGDTLAAINDYLKSARPDLWRECAARLRDKGVANVPRGCVAPMFPGARALAMSPAFLHGIVRQHARACGLPSWITPGSLRSAHEAQLLASGASTPNVARCTGRSAPAIARLEARLAEEQLRSAYRLAHPRA